MSNNPTLVAMGVLLIPELDALGTALARAYPPLPGPDMDGLVTVLDWVDRELKPCPAARGPKAVE